MGSHFDFSRSLWSIVRSRSFLSFSFYCAVKFRCSFWRFLVLPMANMSLRSCFPLLDPISDALIYRSCPPVGNTRSRNFFYGCVLCIDNSLCYNFATTEAVCDQYDISSSIITNWRNNFFIYTLTFEWIHGWNKVVPIFLPHFNSC